MSRTFGRSKAKAALARANRVEVNITGDYEDDRIRFNNVGSALGVVYAENAVSSMQTLDDIDALELALITTNSRLDALEVFMNTTFPAHTHNYQDGTIADTDLGGSTEVETTKTTTIVN